jgi:predicted nucleic acid-binding protein
LILVDTSVWVEHLRSGDLDLAALLERGGVVMHPFVIGEIACGSLARRDSILELLGQLPTAAVAEADEVLGFITRHSLHGKGIGYVELHLLASVVLTPAGRLWTHDKRLHAAAAELGCAYPDSAAH